MASSSDEIGNIAGNIQEIRLESVDDPLDDDDYESALSPQNMPNMQPNSLTISRARRALTFGHDADESPSNIQNRTNELSSSTTTTTTTNRDQPPSNSVNTLHLETRPQSEHSNESNNRPTQLYNWQGTKTTIKERFSFLFNNEILSDVRFLVGRGGQQQSIPAHKLVLSSSSAVFDAMFNGTLATSSAEIEVPDVEPTAFLAVLLFLYTDDIQIDPETVMSVLYTAKKYAVSPLEKHCVDFLRNNLTSDNAFLLLTQARLFDEPQLSSVCLDTIDKFTTDAMNADGFTDIDIDTLMIVLERDTLRVRESKIFQAVIRWSEAECFRAQLPITPENKRSVLGRALSLVRFPLMSVEEFAMGPAQSGLLTDREVVSLFLYFTVNPKPQVGEWVNPKPRCRMMGKELTVCRFKQTDHRWGYSGTSDRIRFSVDKRIFIVGYGVYGSVHYPAEYEVTIELTHTASGKIIASHLTSFSCDGSSYTYRLMFKEPLEIMANTIYTASATFKGPDSHYGTKGKRCVSVDCGSSNNKVKFQFSFAAGDNNGTSIEDGQIPELIFYT